MIVRELLTRLGFQTDDAQAKAYETRIKNIAAAAAAVYAAAVAAGGALFAIASTAATFGDELAKAARVAGITAVELQSLRLAYGEAGVGAEELDTALRFLNKSVGGARRGNKASIQAFQELGVALYDTEGRARSISDVLADSSSALSKLDDQAVAASISMVLFGRSGGRLQALTADSEDLQKSMAWFKENTFGITEDQARQAEFFADMFDRIRKVARDLVLQVGAYLMPLFSKLMVQFLDWYTINKDIIRQNLIAWVDRLVRVLGTLFNAAGTAFGWISGVVNALGGFQNAMEMVAIVLAIMAAPRILAGLAALRAALLAITWAGALIAAGWIAAAAAAALLIAVIQDLWTWFRGGPSVIGKWIGAWDDFPPVLELIGGMFGDLRQAVADLFTGDWRGALDNLSAASRGFIDALVTGLLNIGVVWAGVCLTILDAFAKLVGVDLKSWVDKAKSWFAEMGAYLSDQLGAAFERVSALFSTMMDKLRGFWATFVDWAKGLIGGILAPIQTGIDRLRNSGVGRWLGADKPAAATPSSFNPDPATDMKGAVTSSSATQSNSVSVGDIVVNSPPGADAAEIARLTSAEVRKVIGDTFRTAAYEFPNSEVAA